MPQHPTHPQTQTAPPCCTHHLLVADLVHELEALDGLLFGHADVLLLQRHGAIGVVEVEEPLLGVHVQERGHVLIVGQGGR